jgi:hypothetical protein
MGPEGENMQTLKAVYQNLPMRQLLFSIRHLLELFKDDFVELEGTGQHTWLRHYAKGRDVVGSIPDEVIRFLI